MLSVLRSTCPFPTIDEAGALQGGLNIAQAQKCMKCATKSCRQVFASLPSDGLAHAHCEFGFSLLRIPTAYGPLCVNGVVVPLENNRMDAERRKANRTQKVPWQRVEAYAAQLASVVEQTQKAIGDQVKEAVAGLHDIKTAVSVVLRNAEAIIANSPGSDDAEKIENADPSLKALLKSVSLLNSRLNIGSLVANPEAAAYGLKRPTPVYRVFHRMVRLFEEQAFQRRLRLRMTGSSSNRPLLYDSFETIALVLIENAVKYSEPNREIVVRVDDIPNSHNGCKATVESFGPALTSLEVDRIFERSYRSQRAVAITSAGSGLGLFIAKIVAKANGCELTCACQVSHPTESLGLTTFTVRVGHRQA